MHDDDGEKKTIEEWATARGYLPEHLTVPARVGPFNGEATRPNPKFHLYAAAKAHRAWPIGAEVTATEFDEAVEEAQHLPLA